MKYASICDGIGAVHCAWKPLGWQCQWVSEIEPFCNAVVEHHWGFQNHGDFTKIERSEPIDLLAGGTPCQDFSVAGLRKGLAGARGNLTLEFVALAGRLRAKWLLWENVPGILSSDGGEAFRIFLQRLAECGYGFAWRVLDAQYFGVPQRRRRVFLVGHLGGQWQRCAAVLFERESLHRDITPRREAGKKVAGTIKGGTGSRGYPEPSDGNGDGLIAGAISKCSFEGGSGDKPDGAAQNHFVVSGRAEYREGKPTLRAAGGDLGGGSECLCERERERLHRHLEPTTQPSGGLITSTSMVEQDYLSTAKSLNAHGGRFDSETETFVTDSLVSNGDAHSGFRDEKGIVPVSFERRMVRTTGGQPQVDITGCLRADTNTGDGAPCVAYRGVRRLTPRECERLQGFPDDYTLIKWHPRMKTNKKFKTKLAADAPRYRSLGNSMAVPCMKWLGERIQMVENIK